MGDGSVQLTTDVYLEPVTISNHKAWPQGADGPIPVRRVAFASEVFLFLGTDNMTFFKMTDTKWNGTRARDVAFEDVYNLDLLDVTFDLEQTSGVIERFNFNGTETETKTLGAKGSGTKWTIGNLLGLSLDKQDGQVAIYPEYVYTIAGGYGGFLIATNVSTVWVQQLLLSNDTGKVVKSIVKNVSLADAGLSWEWVTEVDVDVVPIITIDSNELYIFDDPQNETVSAGELGREGDEGLAAFDEVGAKCARWLSDEQGVTRKERQNKWKRLLVAHDNNNDTIPRFVPYPRFAYSRPEEAAQNALPSYYLNQNERTPYVCTELNSEGKKMLEY